MNLVPTRSLECSKHSPKACSSARLPQAGTDGRDTTVAANPHLKRIFGYAADALETDVAPFAHERFIDAGARDAFLERLSAGGAVTDYLLRMRRADGSPVWVEVTARAEAGGRDDALRVDALVRDVSARNSVVCETLALRAYERMSALTVVQALASGLPQVFADAHQIQQVLLNLVINAEQAMLTANGRGTLVIR